MNWIVKIFMGGLRKRVIEDAKKFQWSERELTAMREAGITEGEILSSVAANRVGLAAWIERQIK